MLDAHSTCCRIRLLPIWLIVVSPGLFLAPRLTLAGGPEVHFDLPVILACRQVNPENGTEAIEADAEERVIEVVFPLSIHVRSGDADAIEQVTIEFWTNSDSMRAVDFTPKTQIGTDITGAVEERTTTEVSDSLGISLGGSLPVPYGELAAQVTPSANASRSQRKVTTESTQRLPPLEPTVVSGTTHRGRGVFFQLRQSSQHTFEGSQTFSIRFAVPNDWRIARGLVVCRANGHERLLWMKRETNWSTVRLPVILYAEGDLEARAVAERAEAQLVLKD